MSATGINTIAALTTGGGDLKEINVMQVYYLTQQCTIFDMLSNVSTDYRFI